MIPRITFIAYVEKGYWKSFTHLASTLGLSEGSQGFTDGFYTRAMCDVVSRRQESVDLYSTDVVDCPDCLAKIEALHAAASFRLVPLAGTETIGNRGVAIRDGK